MEDQEAHERTLSFMNSKTEEFLECQRQASVGFYNNCWVC